MEIIRKDAQIMQKYADQIDALYMGKHHLNLTVGTLKDGVIRLAQYNEQKEMTDEELVWPVGSINKLFTASLVAKQIAEGRISLDDRIDRFIDGLPQGNYQTMQRLLTHHSGYGGTPFGFVETLVRLARMNKPNGLLHINPFRGTLDEKRMREILKSKKLEDRDYKFEYSNFAYGTLGYISGSLEGSDYFTAMEKYIKEELQLENTSLNNSNLTGYDKRENPCRPWQWERSDIIAPAGALLSSGEDMLKFAQINMDGSLPYLEMTHKIYAEGEKDFDQGLAWRIRKGSSVLYHVGNAGAFTCMLALDPAKKSAVFIGMNYALAEVEAEGLAMLEMLGS